jgi:hypothetical protein
VKQTVVVKRGDPNCAIGRRPEGFTLRTRSGPASLARHFAEMAELEDASVLAFERLAHELRAYGAPLELIQRAESSARDEVRHARATAALARRYGAPARSYRRTAHHRETARRLPVRSLREIALENAVEGCIRETFGALTATFQAARAKDPLVKKLMGTIADDETAHAALAWDIAVWIVTQLNTSERDELIHAQNETLASLRISLSEEPREDIAQAAGLPRAKEAGIMLEHMALALGRDGSDRSNHTAV